MICGLFKASYTVLLQPKSRWCEFSSSCCANPVWTFLAQGIITMICLYCKRPADSKFEIFSSKAYFTYQLSMTTCSKCDNWQLWPTKALTNECPELFETTDNSLNCLNLAKKHCRQLCIQENCLRHSPRKLIRSLTFLQGNVLKILWKTFSLDLKMTMEIFC